MKYLMSLGWMLCAAVCLGAPEIAVVTEPACNGETVILTGSGFNQGKLSVRAMVVSNTVDRTPPKGAQTCEIIGSGENYLQVVFKNRKEVWMRAPVVSAIWVGDETGWSEPILVNRPQAKWAQVQRDMPCDVVRIFGGVFSWGYMLKPAKAFLRNPGETKLTELEWISNHQEDSHAERWNLNCRLPENLAAGNYEILVHGGHGGDLGWSDPLKITVRPKATVGKVVNLKDAGAKGDGITDDTAAFEAALKDAVGGTLLVPQGSFVLTKTVVIPNDVRIRGQGMHQSLIASGDNFTGRDLLQCMSKVEFRDLTLRFDPANGSALRIGQDPLWSEDVGLFRTRFESRQDFGLAKGHGYHSRPVNIVKARRLRMVRCETYGPGAVSCERKVEDSEFTQNRFLTDRRWRGHVFKFWGVENTVFEDNLMTGDGRGFVMQTHFGVNYRNYIAGNTIERTVLAGNAGETFLIEGAGLLFESGLSGVSASKIRTKNWGVWFGKPANEEQTVGRFVLIARGKGLGQYRRIVKCNPQTHDLELDHPWRVIPDQSSTVVVMNGTLENVFLSNQEIDCGKGLYFYGAGAVNNVVDRHLCDRSMGILFMAHDDRQSDKPEDRETAPDFFNYIRDCHVHYGGGLFCSAGGRLPLVEDKTAPMASFANRFFDNEIQNTAPYSGSQYGANWTWGGGWDNICAAINVQPQDLGIKPGGGTNGPARIVSNVFQNNWVSETQIGVGISQRAENTVLMKNAFYCVPKQLVDRGIGTKESGTATRTPDDYSPERSPIR